MNIAIFSHMEIFPIDGGAPNRIFHLAKAVSAMGENVYLILNSRNEYTKKIGNLTILRCPYSKSKLPKLHYIFSRLNLVKEFKKIDKEIDIIQCEFPYIFHWAYLAKLYRNTPIVLDEHGVETIFIREIHCRPDILSKTSVFLRELTAVKLSSHIFTCSKVDLEQLSRIYRITKNKITEIPNAVNQGFFEEIAPYDFKKPTILFLGGFTHPPNCHAAKLIIKDIMPQVIEREKDVQFVFIGHDPPAWLKNTDHLKILGYVSDVRPFIKGADIGIAPILHGSGTRLKILEYMALGKPVISTSKGAEGIEVVNDDNIIIENNIPSFSNHIISLLCDQVKANKLGENAKKLIKEKYTWEKVAIKAIEVYKKLISDLK